MKYQLVRLATVYQVIYQGDLRDLPFTPASVSEPITPEEAWERVKESASFQDGYDHICQIIDDAAPHTDGVITQYGYARVIAKDTGTELETLAYIALRG